jgi:hypothetical protein
MRSKRQRKSERTEARLRAIKDALIGNPIRRPRKPQGVWILENDGTYNDQNGRVLSKDEYCALVDDDDDLTIIAMEVISTAVFVLPAKTSPTERVIEIASRIVTSMVGPKKVRIAKRAKAIEQAAPIVAAPVAKKEGEFDIDAFMENAISYDELGRYRYEIGQRLTRPLRIN